MRTQTTTLSGGTATCQITASDPGTYVVTAAYGGSTNYLSVTSSPDTVTVAALTPTVTVTNSPLSPTLRRSGHVLSDRCRFGRYADGIGHVGRNRGFGSYLHTEPGDAERLWSRNLHDGRLEGRYVLRSTATYGGNGSYAGVTSSADQVVVVAATPAVAVANSTPTTLGSTITFSATVSGPSGGATPTGNGHVDGWWDGRSHVVRWHCRPDGLVERGDLHMHDHRLDRWHLRCQCGLRRRR